MHVKCMFQWCTYLDCYGTWRGNEDRLFFVQLLEYFMWRDLTKDCKKESAFGVIKQDFPKIGSQFNRHFWKSNFNKKILGTCTGADIPLA